MNKTRYAQVGLGDRSILYTWAITQQYSETAELAAICDSNPGRINLRKMMAEASGVNPGCFTSDKFGEMIVKTKPDIVVVTTIDSTHDYYICKALEMGCDVITEKPMTIDAEKCQRIIHTQQKTGGNIQVTFNYRYAPFRTQVKKLLLSGVIGDVTSVDFHWLLDTNHGADYFRRWHRKKRNSGGLLVHKATHHFDLINWWLSTVPHKVYAEGARNFYKPETAERYGLRTDNIRCLDCQDSYECPFYFDLSRDGARSLLYLENEEYDDYFRDRCVFSSDIDIEDSMQAVVRYSNGVSMSYSQHAFMPWEGYVIYFNGSKGRLEHICQETSYTSGDGSIPGEVIQKGTKISIHPHFKEPYEVEIDGYGGGHGGADPLLIEDIFSREKRTDPYHHKADHRAGAWSILTGIAANLSIECGKPIEIESLISDLELPDYSVNQTQ